MTTNNEPTIVLDHQAAIALLQDHFDGAERIRLELDAGFAFMLIGTLQLALRHPKNTGITSETMREFKDDLIRKLANGNDDIETIIRCGDDPAFDVLHGG